MMAISPSKIKITGEELAARVKLAKETFTAGAKAIDAWKRASHALQSWPPRSPVVVRNLAKSQLNFSFPKCGSRRADKPKPAGRRGPQKPRPRVSAPSVPDPTPPIEEPTIPVSSDEPIDEPGADAPCSTQNWRDDITSAMAWINDDVIPRQIAYIPRTREFIVLTTSGTLISVKPESNVPQEEREQD